MKTILTMCLAASLTFAQFTQQGQKLVGTGAVTATKFGRSVAVSADGNTAVVGSPGENTGHGGVWVYTRAGGDWVQQGPPLLSVENTEPNLGSTVAISADGNTIIAGDYYGSTAARVFTRTNGVWTQQGLRLVGTNAPNSGVGISVAISADGATAIISASGDGTAWIFTQSNGVWAQQGDKLIGTGANISGSLSITQGASAALSADGNTALVGGSLDDSGIGAAWIFVRSNGVWAQQGAKLVGSGSVGAAQQGISVSLSADGNTASVAGPFDKSSDLTQTIGAAWVFTRANGVWIQQGSKLVGGGSVGNAVTQGSSLSLSSDGNTLLLGGPGDDSDNGALWSFTRSNGVWTLQGGKLAGTGASGHAGLGTSLSVSANGNAVIAGGIYDDNGVGAIWTFARASGVWTQQGLKLVKPQLDGGARQGNVAVSQDGNTAIVGGSADKGALGATWIFTRSSGVWSQQGPKLVGSGSEGLAGPRSNGFIYQGTAVAISADSNTTSERRMIHPL